MSMPLISCIIPTYNGEKYLAEALDSILEQRYRPIEVIIADDGSSDGTAEIADRYGDVVRRTTQANAGPAATRNLGIRSATGTFVAFLDQDDVWRPEKLERQYARFEARPELDISVAHVQRFWESALSEQAERFRNHRISKPLPGYITGTMLVRRNVFDRAGAFNSSLRYGDTMEWFLRAVDAGAIAELLPDVLLMHRMHARNLSRSEGAGSRSEFLEIIKSTLDRRRGSRPPKTDS
jgi:glycosyltransferase involved in cell wall biosynthesis